MGLKSERLQPEQPVRPLEQGKAATHWTDSNKLVFLMPAVLLVLFLSIFPLIASLFTSLSRIRFVQGGFDISYVGLKNFEKLLIGKPVIP